MGCNTKKLRNNSFLKYFSLFFCFILFFLIFSVDVSAYIPAAPTGPSEGLVDEGYEFKIYTMESAASWKFDWGDGNYSDWVSLDGSLDYVSQNYSWDKEGVYAVRIQHKTKYIGESQWSSPLKIIISIPSDIDNDGWENDIESAYGTNVSDENDYPLDSDSDGKPDDDSLDGVYTGDADDDNDGLSDEIELSLNLDPLDKSDVKSVKIEGKTHFLIDYNNDSEMDSFYNSETKKVNNVYIDGKNIFIDVDDDGDSDYTYDKYIGIVQKYISPQNTDEGDTTMGFPWSAFIITVIMVVFLVVFLLFKKGIFYVYEQECEVEEDKEDKIHK